ncbi:diguanylate cyclase [bacterium]|nr:diguanylate cyclase [bacterium]
MEKPPKKKTLLVCVKKKSNINLLRKFFEDKYEILYPHDLEKKLQKNLDLIIFDSVSFNNYRDSLLQKRQKEAPRYLPFLLLLDMRKAKYTSWYLEKGIDEIIYPPIRKVELENRIRLLLQLRDMSVSLHQRAIYDSLTGLYNRRYFNEIIRKEISRSRRHHHPLIVFMLDVNHFKWINDEFSHSLGDKVLKGIAGVLAKHVRESDYLFRYGGDEFLMICLETEKGAEKIAGRIREAVKEWNRKNALFDFDLDLAIGSSIWRPEGNRNIEEVLKDADQKMYKDKEGRGRKEMREKSSN